MICAIAKRSPALKSFARHVHRAEKRAERYHRLKAKAAVAHKLQHENCQLRRVVVQLRQQAEQARSEAKSEKERAIKLGVEVDRLLASGKSEKMPDSLLSVSPLLSKLVDEATFPQHLTFAFLVWSRCMIALQYEGLEEMEITRICVDGLGTFLNKCQLANTETELYRSMVCFRQAIDEITTRIRITHNGFQAPENPQNIDPIEVR